MSLLELTVLLMIIGSVAQYLFGLAVYVEKKLVVVSQQKIACSFLPQFGMVKIPDVIRVNFVL